MLTQATQRTMRQAFDLFNSDDDTSSRVNIVELGRLFQAVGFNVEKSRMSDLIHDLGFNKNESIDFPEFLQVC